MRGLRELRDVDVAPDVFEALERRFATQARYTTQLTGLTGLYMTWRLDLWSRFADPAYWWMDAMVLLYLVFTMMLFVLEPFVLHRRFQAGAAGDPVGTRRALLRMRGRCLFQGPDEATPTSISGFDDL